MKPFPPFIQPLVPQEGPEDKCNDSPCRNQLQNDRVILQLRQVRCTQHSKSGKKRSQRRHDLQQASRKVFLAHAISTCRGRRSRHSSAIAYACKQPCQMPHVSSPATSCCLTLLSRPASADFRRLCLKLEQCFIWCHPIPSTPLSPARGCLQLAFRISILAIQQCSYWTVCCHGSHSLYS